MNQNRLNPDNCNKTYCKTCIFHPEESNRIQLSQERINEIKKYLATFESSHICHQTNLTCYGALKFQAQILFSLEIIKENTVDCLLETAKQFLR